MKTILLMRHSIPYEDGLSEEGIIFANKVKLSLSKTIDNVYSSPIGRAYETAKIFSPNVKVMQSLKEREIGIAKEDFWLKQYQNYDYKNEDGESLNETKLRMKDALDSILNDVKDNSCALVVSHATAICAYLSNFCVINVIDANSKIREIIFEDELVCSDNLNYACYFVMEFNEKN